MRALALVLLGLAMSAVPAAAQDDCTTSPGGTHSFTVLLNPGAGGRALYDIRVSTGAICDEAALFGWATLGSRSRLAVTDTGVLVSILAPRTSHRDWNIVMLTVVAPRARDARSVRLSLDELAGTAELRGSVAAAYDGGSVVFTGRSGEVRVTFADLGATALRSD